MKDMKEMPDLLPRKELARRMGVSPRTIINYEKVGLPVHMHIGRSPRYSYEEVFEWFVNYKPTRIKAKKEVK